MDACMGKGVQVTEWGRVGGSDGQWERDKGGAGLARPGKGQWFPVPGAAHGGDIPSSPPKPGVIPIDR